jgi:glycosyltransferase involved in cell wall biosynthesis
MKNKPLVSVIVASYGNAPYLKDMIESILSQTYPNWELIITDDASPDNSNIIIEKYLDNTGIKLYKHKTNKGAGAAFKTCMNNAKGEIVAMLGADDALKPNALEVIVQKYKENPNAAMIIGGLELTDNNLKPLNNCRIFKGIPDGLNSILDNEGAFGWDTFKKANYDQTEGFDENLKSSIDQDLYYKLEETGKVMFISDCLYLYRKNEKGISQSNKALAYQYRRKAMINAYYRRKRENSKINISKSKKNTILYYYYVQEALFSFSKFNPIGILQLITAFLYSPTMLFKKENYISVYQRLIKNKKNNNQNSVWGEL